MKKLLAVAALFLSPAAAIPPPPLPDPAAELRDAALEDELAWELVEGLTTEVGPRLAGTEAEERARDWAVRRLTELGFANVHVEPFDMPVWVRGEERAEILSPFPQPLVVTALGNSAATPAQGLEARVVGFETLADLQAAPDAIVEGRIVFVSPEAQAGNKHRVRAEVHNRQEQQEWLLRNDRHLLTQAVLTCSPSPHSQ